MPPRNLMKATPQYTFRWSDDKELIRSIIADPRVFHAMKSDLSPPIHQFRVQMPATMLAVIVERGKVPVGLVLLDTQTPGSAHLHFCLLPDVWGKSLTVGREFLKWAWENTSLLRLDGHIPSYNRQALKFVKALGFREYGHRKDAVIWKHKKVFAIVMVTLRRA